MSNDGRCLIVYFFRGGNVKPAMKKLIATCLFIWLIFGFTSVCSSDDPGSELSSILYTAESLFKSMKGNNYTAVWGFLTIKSKNIIVKAVRKASAKAGVKYSEEQITHDFGIGGPLSRAYWDSYLSEFDPDMVLEHSRWDMGPVTDKTAVILLHYQKSKKPAILQMYKENGTWKVGLEETFSPRRILK